MDRDELIGKATAFYATHVCEDYGWQPVQMWMADFALSLIGTREFIDLQSTLAYEAGRRAERSRIVDEIETNIGRYKTPRAQMLSLKANVLDKLRAEPAESETASFWWCDHCKEEVDGSRVTFQEHHDTCGYMVRCLTQSVNS